MLREAAALVIGGGATSPSAASTDERAQLAAYESRVEADRAVFAKAASIRRLSAVPIPAFDYKSSNQELSATLSTLATHRSSLVRKTSTNLGQAAIAAPLVRRPSTAASAHSRVHQVLRRNESEFVLSSKEATVDGFLYSSRFDHLTHLNTKNNSPLQPQLRQRLAKVGKKAGCKASATAAHEGLVSMNGGGDLGSEASVVEASEPSGQEPQSAVSTEDLPSSQQRRRRAISDEVSQQHATEHLLVDPKSTTAQQKQSSHAADELSITQRKRRCAKTFEEMILARLNETASDPGSLDQSMAKLLGHGMIQSVLELSAIADAATQAHCCRALYYLSQVPSARKAMVAHGVVGTIKALSRITAPRSRQDLAATLCHLSEENGLVEVLLFEGIDQSLSRMFTAASSQETKRICALTVFNISVDAVTIKHFGDAFTQLLVLSTRTAGGGAVSENLIKAVYNASLVSAFHAALLGENIPRFLLHQLPHVSPTAQILALRALVALCDSKANRTLMLSQGFCKLLEAMLASTNEDIQETTLTILLLLSIDDGARIKLCNWVPAATIVQAASQHVENLAGAIADQGDRLVYLQSCVLRNLCDSVLTHHELVEEGAVRVLLEMSRMEDSDIKSNAICALCCIIASSTDEVAGYVLEITVELLALTETQLPKNVAFAVGALYNIVCSDDCLPLLAESPQLLERMLALAMAEPLLNQDEDRVAALVAAILYRLASLKDHQHKMLQHGVFPVLVHLIHRFPSGRTFAVNALYLLAQDGGEHFPHGGDEVAKLALALSEQDKPHSQLGNLSSLSAKLRPSGGVSEDPTTTLRSAVTLLAHLARHPKNQSALVRNGAVFCFLRRLKRLDDDETILINCAFVYFSLTATQEGCEQLIKELGVEDIIHISRSSKLATHSNQQVKELCMLALCRLSSFIGLESKLIEHGAIDAVMIMALVTTDSPLIKALCIKALANCLVAKNCVRPLIDHGIIWALASLAQVDSSETRYACAVSLCNLSAVTNMLSRFLDAGAPRALIHLLKQSDKSSATLMTTIKAIANLVANEKICAVFLNEELEKHLSVHFKDPGSSEELRQLAAMVLLRVTSANDAMISLEHLKHGVFVWMEQIIIMKEAELVRNCMLTVHDLTCNSSIDVGELDVEHILRIVIQVFHRHQQNDEVITLCLTIVYNLSCQRCVLPRLVIPEIMGFLRQHVPSSSGSQERGKPFKGSSGRISITGGKLSLASAAASMLSAASAIAADVKLCCLVLHNLSCHHTYSPSAVAAGGSTELLASLVNFRAVAMLHDVYVSRDDLKEICALATCNFVVGRVNSSRVLEDHAGELLVHFISSSFFHESHHLLVSAALRKLVNAPGNQQILLEAGVVQAIVFMLGLAELGHEACLNLLAALGLVSKCSDHLSKLLDDGVLPSVIRIAEAKATPGDLLSYCFEILSNVCAVNFEEQVRNHPEINVISTLIKLSEHHFHHQTNSSLMTPNGGSSQARTPVHSMSAKTGSSYCDRGEGTALGVPQLLTFMVKSPSNAASLKKNLELTATYTVPVRKWAPDAAHAVPKDPPPLECNEIPLTETSQSIPADVKQRIRNLVALPKEALMRDEAADDSAVVVAQASGNNGSSRNLLGDLVANKSSRTLSDVLLDRDALLPSAFRKLSADGGDSKKKLQRGLAGRNLSHSGLSQNRSGLLFG